jgi:hypothetical protein
VRVSELRSSLTPKRWKSLRPVPIYSRRFYRRRSLQVVTQAERTSKCRSYPYNTELFSEFGAQSSWEQVGGKHREPRDTIELFLSRLGEHGFRS